MAGAGYKLFNTGDVLTAAQVNTYLQQQVIMVFADASARTTALSGVLSEGMFSYLTGTNAFQYYDGAAWVDVSNPGDITAVNVTSPITGGGSSGAVTIGINAATTSVVGAVQLSDSTSTTSSVLAATPTAVKSAYDLAAAAQPAALTLNAQTGTTYTLIASDATKLVTLTNAAAITLTLPPSVFTTGQQINLAQLGAGQVTFAAGVGVTIVSTGATAAAPKISKQYGAATAICTASDTFLVVGSLS